MEIIQFASSMRRRRGYNRMSSPTKNRNKMKVARLGGARRSWRVRLAPKLRLVRAASPMRLWSKLKNAYINMMLKIANNAGSSNVFGAKRIPKARDVPMAYSRSEFENRLIFEIYKSMVPSYELGYTK